MKKTVLLTLVLAFIGTLAFSQTDRFWSASNESSNNISKDKAVARLSFPKTFKLFNLNLEPLRKELFTVVDKTTKQTTVISLPNADGKLEQFEVFEASNFEPALQAQFPEIRAFSGKGLTDRYATLKMSISPQGIETMVFRTDKENEFIEPFSKDHTIYAVFKSQREKGKLPWSCSTDDRQTAADLNSKILHTNGVQSSTGELKTMRLAQSVTAEYSNYFGAFNSSQLSLVLAAINTTLTRCNGCYEKDLGIHLNLIPNESLIIYYDPNTDPYSPASTGAGGAWNGQLQATLTAVIGEANYDIGHLFGASGGGGNAGCIGCVCVNGQKGSGFTSPADGIPMGDNFDIDYVVHEVGHQMGANHTFTFSNEGTGQQKEVGAGITIMGYAGITSYDPAPHSIDIYHETSIAQIQANMATKTCPVTTSIAGNNATPVVAPVNNYTIPISTPFALTGSATDADNDPLTYCWEQNDNTSTLTGANSVAFPTKSGGPNWLSFSPTASPTRLFPKLSTILAGLFVTPPLPGGDAICNIEALSSVSRTLNFRLTVRDNHPFSPTTPVAVGQTAFTDMTVTVTSTSGPFQVSAPNTNITWNEGATQTVTWAVNGTTGAPVSCSAVKISLSIDGGTTFPYVLAASTANDGTEDITVPSGTTTSTARIKIEAVGNIFFDISDANFTIAAPVTGFTFTTPTNGSVSCAAATSASITLGTTSNGGYVVPINLSASGNPAGTTVGFSVNPLIPGNSTVVTLNNTNTLNAGTYTVTVTGVSGSITQTQALTYIVQPGTGPSITVQPVSQVLCAGSNVTFSITAPTALTYQWQLSTDGGTNFSNIGGATATSYTINGITAAQNNYQYRCVAGGQCNTTTSNAATLTVNTAPNITTQPVASTVCATQNTSFTVAATGTGLTYQWQLSTNGCATSSNLIDGGFYTGVNTPTLTITGATTALNNNMYKCIVSGTCAPAVATPCTPLVVNTPVSVTAQPAASIICAGSNTTFSVTATGTTPTYQWQESTNGGSSFTNITNGGIYSGATTATLTLTGVTAGMNTYQYRCIVSGATSCSPLNTNNAALTVNTAPAITTQPAAATTLCSGSSLTYSVGANGTALTYQWQISTAGAGGPWTNITNGGVYTGATTAALTLTGITAGMNGSLYRNVIGGTCAPAATSANSALTVISPVTITTQPAASTAICSTGNTSFTVTGNSSVSIIYQWQVSTDGGATWTNVANAAPYSGATTATLTITNVPTTLSGYKYRVLLSNATCTAPTVSASSALTVNVLPTAAIAASAPAIQAGQSSVITATTTPTTGLSIAWFRNGVLVPGATSNTYSVNVNTLGDYKVVVTDLATGTCINQSNVVTIAALPSDKLFIYPSPSDGQFTVTYYNSGSTTTEGITIYDSYGREVYNNTFAVTQAYQLHKIDLRRNSAGVYYVVLRDANGKKIKTGEVLIR